MEELQQQHPQARDQKLLTRELPDGLLIYDLERDRGHFLNRTATLIWQHCDGTTSVAALASLLRKQELPADEDLVWLALSRLEKAHLLQEPLVRPTEGMSRREVIRKLGLAAGLTALIPVVTSIAAPTPAMAQSPGDCKNNGSPCTTSAECCSGCCNQEGSSQVCANINACGNN
jgi:hypothetical protein